MEVVFKIALIKGFGDRCISHCYIEGENVNVFI